MERAKGIKDEIKADEGNKGGEGNRKIVVVEICL
jgi:hypothetical protein